MSQPVLSSCPCCGHPMAVPNLEAACRDVGPIMARILRVVAQRPGISLAALVDAVYADDPEGGPLTARATLVRRIGQERTRLARHGLRVRGPRGTGTYAAGYRLHVVPALMEDRP